MGRVNTEREEYVPHYYVRSICWPICGTNRLITGNWFTSIDIFNKMNDEYKLTMLGTVRKNGGQIPFPFAQTASSSKSLDYCTPINPV